MPLIDGSDISIDDNESSRGGSSKTIENNQSPSDIFIAKPSTKCLLKCTIFWF
jgi:hypothetical protein